LESCGVETCLGNETISPGVSEIFQDRVVSICLKNEPEKWEFCRTFLHSGDVCQLNIVLIGSISVDETDPGNCLSPSPGSKASTQFSNAPFCDFFCTPAQMNPMIVSCLSTKLTSKSLLRFLLTPPALVDDATLVGGLVGLYCAANSGSDAEIPRTRKITRGVAATITIRTTDRPITCTSGYLLSPKVSRGSSDTSLNEYQRHRNHVVAR
jgi:hypothetical protein